VLTPTLGSAYDLIYTSSQSVIRDGDIYRMYYAGRVDAIHKWEPPVTIFRNHSVGCGSVFGGLSVMASPGVVDFLLLVCCFFAFGSLVLRFQTVRSGSNFNRTICS
jgi:hypothetical protein